jgi:hypothetical protein
MEWCVHRPFPLARQIEYLQTKPQAHLFFSKKIFTFSCMSLDLFIQDRDMLLIIVIILLVLQQHLS